MDRDALERELGGRYSNQLDIAGFIIGHTQHQLKFNHDIRIIYALDVFIKGLQDFYD